MEISCPLFVEGVGDDGGCGYIGGENICHSIGDGSGDGGKNDVGEQQQLPEDRIGHGSTVNNKRKKKQH